jgi:hypothetical protein
METGRNALAGIICFLTSCTGNGMLVHTGGINRSRNALAGIICFLTGADSWFVTLNLGPS